jgi:hypothetical protein
MQLRTASAEDWFVDPARCAGCAHPAWTHGLSGACGLLSLYGFDLAALPFAEPTHAPA